MAYRDRRFTCADAGREADAPLHTLIFAYVLGLRLSEIAAVRMAMHKEQAGRPNFGIKRAVDGHCEFRRKLDSDSSRSWTVIPRQAGH